MPLEYLETIDSFFNRLSDYEGLLNNQFRFFQGQILKVAKDKSIENSNFNPKRKTKFIIHGFIDTPLSNWVKVRVFFYLYYIFSPLYAYISLVISFIHNYSSRIFYRNLA